MSDKVSDFVGNTLSNHEKIENWVCVYKDIDTDYGRVLTSMPIEDTINILRHYADLLETGGANLTIKGKLH